MLELRSNRGNCPFGIIVMFKNTRSIGIGHKAGINNWITGDGYGTKSSLT